MRDRADLGAGALEQRLQPRPVMRLDKALGASEQLPHRSIPFMGFAHEVRGEAGLLGRTSAGRAEPRASVPSSASSKPTSAVSSSENTLCPVASCTTWRSGGAFTWYHATSSLPSKAPRVQPNSATIDPDEGEDATRSLRRNEPGGP